MKFSVIISLNACVAIFFAFWVGTGRGTMSDLLLLAIAYSALGLFWTAREYLHLQREWMARDDDEQEED